MIPDECSQEVIVVSSFGKTSSLVSSSFASSRVRGPRMFERVACVMLACLEFWKPGASRGFQRR